MNGKKTKKDCRVLTVRMDTDRFNRLERFCELSGQTKTVAVERALDAYMEKYEEVLLDVENTRGNLG